MILALACLHCQPSLEPMCLCLWQLAPWYGLEPLIPSFHNRAFAEDIDVAEVGEAVDISEVVADDHDTSSSFHSQAPGKTFVLGRIACLVCSSPAPLG